MQDVTWLLHLSSQTDDYPTADIVRATNRYYDRACSIIYRADSRWQFDDSVNQADLPIARTNLVSGQADYGISSATFLRILKVLAKDSNGDFHILAPMDINDPEAAAYLKETESQGNPTKYDKLGDSIILSPTPDYASTNGLKIYFQRAPSYFTASSTTQEPGFAEIFHRYLSIGAAYDYALSWGMSRQANLFKQQLDEMELAMTEWYSQRPRDEKPRMRLRREDYGQGRFQAANPDKLPLL